MSSDLIWNSVYPTVSGENPPVNTYSPGNFWYESARVAAIEEAYMSVSSDPELQNRIKQRMLDQTRGELYGLLVQKRNNEYETFKSISGAGGGSSLIPGYKYSYSGADAKAWAYYPGKSAQLKAQREGLMMQLREAEQRLGAQNAWISNEIDRIDAYGDDFVSEEQVDGIRDQINSLPRITDNGWICLDSLATISLNIHEPRSQVRALGHKGIKGFAGSVRTIAGTMIFTIVEGHPLRQLMLLDDEVGSKPSHRGAWSIDNYLTGRGTAYTNGDKLSKLATMLTPFSIHLQYKTEYLPQHDFGGSTGMGAALSIDGIQIISEGIVTSVNDIVTEITYQFIAEDVKEFSGQTYADLVNQSPVLSIDNYSTEEILHMLNTDYSGLIESTTYSSSYDQLVGSIMLDEVNAALGTMATDGGTAFRATPEEIDILRN